MTHQGDSPRLLPPHGGYRRLKSYQMAEIVHDGTAVFCDRFIERRSRTHDQMVQAGRSGKQNVAEASMASGTSKKTELKLTGVARASRRSCWWTFRISCGSTGSRCGQRMTRGQ